MIRVGTENNPIVFTRENFLTAPGAIRREGDDLILKHEATGATLFRYSLDFGRGWSSWIPYENVTRISSNKGQKKHLIVDVSFIYET